MLLDVVRACREAISVDAAHLVTRETGRAVRAVLARRIAELAPGSVVTLDFSGVGIIDFSCADECLAKLFSRLIAGEYGDRYVLLTGLGESQRENIHVALERKRLPAILVGPGEPWSCLGTITPHLSETLRLVVARGRLSARELMDLLSLELTTSSTRLGGLFQRRLVKRHERAIGEGGREFIYECLVPNGSGGSGGGVGG